MNNYKATPGQWIDIEFCDKDDFRSAGIKELRSRIEQLESQANHIRGATKMVPPPVATDKELDETWDKPPGERKKRFRALYNLGVAHGLAGSREVAEPAPVAGELVDRVVRAVTLGSNPNICVNIWSDIAARAAIIEVARWMRDQGWVDMPDALEQEAGR